MPDNQGMSPDRLFSICNTLVLPGWLLLLFAPRWRWTQRIAALVLPLTLAAVYLALNTTQFGGSGGNFNTLAGVRLLFENPNLLLAGWIHYLAFDLFTGSWIARDAIRNHIPMGLVFPCLLLTFLFGPIGLLGYMACRASLTRKLAIE